MTTWPIHAAWRGPIVMVGFGAIGRGTLPLLLRHIECDRSLITILDPSEENRRYADAENITFIRQGLTHANHKKVLKPLLTTGNGQALIINLSVDVGSIDMMKLARKTGSLYVDTVIEPWLGFYYNPKLGTAGRSNYVLREAMLEVKRKLGKGPTAVSCCGANPGMVSWFVKQALLNIAADLKLAVAEPTTREGWAKLMKRLGIKGLHIAERDTQRAKQPKPAECFVNTWSVEGFISEGLQPAELGWGTHEKKLPPLGKRHKTGSCAAIYLDRPGADCRVRTWTPTSGAHFGYLVTHNEAISVADYFTLRDGKKVTYRPTCHYAYHPCNDAVLSLHEMFGRGGVRQKQQHILEAEEILDGMDELGVLLYGHKRNAYWFGSQLTAGEARRLAPNNSATTMQVTSAVLAGIVWAIENPGMGIVETDEMDFHRCLAVQRPYLGPVNGVYTNWTPLENRGTLFAEVLDRKDPWQFGNVLVK